MLSFSVSFVLCTIIDLVLDLSYQELYIYVEQISDYGQI